MDQNQRSNPVTTHPLTRRQEPLDFRFSLKRIFHSSHRFRS
jgi:hypothetical protein